MPVHIVGLMATGQFSFSSGDLNYEAYVANGPSIDTSVATPSDREIEINDSGDPNSDKSFGFRATYTPASLDLSVSLFAMSNTVADSGNAGSDLVSQTISGLDLNYQMGDFDLIAEYYNLSNKDEVGSLGTQTGNAYYAQFGYQVADDWKVTFRHEAISTKEGQDRYFK
ncbi:MAG: outer membrane beta-barrel protein, partial [Gammaproteobacteria bacterium]|nr:outer membrane beta-barrel protein [Gammaproteobacteria bacterium]